MVDARKYHERTNHTPRRLREDDFRLDRSNQPRPYKIYEDLPVVDPPSDSDPPDVPALAAVAHPEPAPEAARDGPDLHTVCHYAAGVTKTLERAGQEVRYRAAACTGKLYHVDLYAVAGDLPGIGPGVYHYDPDSDAFDVLREGDYRGALAAAAGGQAGIATAPVTFIATSEWWRNAWKYRERTYRHAFWDSGTILANLLAVAHAGGHRAEIVTGFADDPVTRLLGLAPDEEAPLELVPVGSGDPAPATSTVEPLDPAEAPLSPETVDYPLVPDAWRQSRLENGDAARTWRESVAASAFGRDPGDGERIVLDPVDRETASARPVGETIARRGSLREYSHEPISARKFATVLDRALRGVPSDAFAGGDGIVDCFCLVHAVEGIEGGVYQYHPREDELERVGDTDRQAAGRLALDQTVVGHAAVNVFLTADVNQVVERLGNRGYRLAQLEAGVALGRLYLATYAHLALGGRGFTFYDDLVTEHLAPAAGGQSPMTLFAFGRPRDR